tara:strand:- start:2277 stop:3113 length:837 start_codon:yes stop_codon:yes gene_type:complete
MSWANMSKKEQPIIVVGKPSTGKTTIALAMLQEPLVFFANEFEEGIPSNTELLIEDVHIKANTKEIVKHLQRATAKVILTSIDKKSIPAPIKKLCKIKLAGATVHLPFASIAPRSVPALNPKVEIFDMLKMYLRNRDRDEVARILKSNRPPDVFLMNALSDHVHFNRLLFVDAKVKRRWKHPYFYEMLAYAFNGGHAGRFSMPKFAQDKERRRILRRLGFKVNEWDLLMDIVKGSEDFQNYTQKRLNNQEYRLLGIGEKPITRKVKQKRSKVTLEDYI